MAIFEIGVAAVVTNAYPGTAQLAAANVPLVTVTDKFVAGWMGTLVNFGAVISVFGAALARAVGASRILFALGRDAGPAMLRRTSRCNHPGHRDSPAVRIPAVASRDRELAPAQSRCQRAARHQRRQLMR